MDTSSLIPVLALSTFLTGILIGVWQYRRARAAEKTNEQAVSETGLELRADPPGNDPQRVRPMRERVAAVTMKVV